MWANRSRIPRAADAVIQASLVGFAGSLPVSIAFTQISLGVGIIAWAVKVLSERSLLKDSTPLDKGFLSFFTACLLSTVLSAQPWDSLLGMKKFYLVLAVYWVGFNVRGESRRGQLTMLFVAMTALTSLYGVAMYLWGMQSRLLGTQTMAMTSGGIMIMAILLWIPSLHSVSDRWLKEGNWLIGLLLAAGIILNKTISAWAGMVGGLAVYFMRKKAATLIVAALVIFGISLSAALPHLKGGFFDYSKLESWQARMTMWDNGWKIIKKSPVLGTGLIDLGEHYQRERSTADIQLHGNNRRVGHLHNNFIHITAITGFVGLAAFCFLWLVIIAFQIQLARSVPFGLRNRRVSYLSVSSAFLINGLAEWNFGDSEVVTVLWFSLGLALSSWRQDREHGGADPAQAASAGGQ